MTVALPTFFTHVRRGRAERRLASCPPEGEGVPMDIATIHRNADRVASIFNGLSIFVIVIGVITAVLVLIGGFTSDADGAIIQGIALALVALIYTAITWAGVQLAALVAGYIKVRTSAGAVER